MSLGKRWVPAGRLGERAQARCEGHPRAGLQEGGPGLPYPQAGQVLCQVGSMPRAENRAEPSSWRRLEKEAPDASATVFPALKTR